LKSRLLAGLAAVVMAGIGIILVVAYAQGADRRAMDGLQPVDVLVVQQAVPAGTPVESLAKSVATKPLPTDAVTKSSLKNLDNVAGKVTKIDLIPGDQLAAERFIDPADLAAPGSVPVPKGLQEVSFALDPQRTVGASIAPGDSAGLFVSFDKGADPAHPDSATTQFIFHRVLVTNIQKTEQTAKKDESAVPPTGTILVTIAVNDVTAAKVVFGAEFGTIWLSKEPADATESAPRIIRNPEVYR
jgi:pilus assembly protein CpaB